MSLTNLLKYCECLPDDDHFFRKAVAMSRLEILRLAVFNKEDARPPTKLTVSYKGWWHTPLLHVPLAMEPLRDGVHATRKDGKITLVQRFASGKAPTFRVKGSSTSSSKLVIRLYSRRSLRTRAQVEVGHLVSGTAERLTKVDFEVKIGGKVERGFLVVGQLSPLPTPPPPPVYPVGHKRVSSPGVQECSFPVGEYEPSQARLEHLVQEMSGPMPDPGEWPVSPSPPRAQRSPLESLPSPAQSDGEADDASRQTEGDAGKESDLDEERAPQSVERAFQSSTAPHSEDESQPPSPQTSPRLVGDRYVRLWNAVFGERTTNSEHCDSESRGQPVFEESSGRQQGEASPHFSLAIGEVSGCCQRLWDEVFGQCAECASREERRKQLKERRKGRRKE